MKAVRLIVVLGAMAALSACGAKSITGPKGPVYGPNTAPRVHRDTTRY